MKKKKLKIVLITNQETNEYNLLGEYDEKNNIIYYNEKSKLVNKMQIDLKNKILIRENKDYLIKYNLLENKETINKINIKELNQYLDIKIKTEKFKITGNKIEIKYILVDSNEKVTYIINM